MYLKKLTKSASSLIRMTALRQAVVLTFLFLFIIIVAGVSSLLLIKKEILSNVDQELRINYQKISTEIAQSNLAALQLQSNPLLMLSFTPHQGEIVGSTHQSLYKREGFFDQAFRVNKEKDDWRVLSSFIPQGRLAVAINMEQRLEVLEIAAESFVIIGALSTLTTLIAGLFIGFKTQRRFGHISNTLDKIAAGDLNAKIAPPSNRDDLDQVAVHIDKTTAQLAQLLEQTRNLSANIAHDLKTPLARLRAKLERMLISPEEHFNELAIEDSLDQTDQLIAIFEAILRIAHLSNGQYRERFKPLSLAKITSESADIYQAVIEDSQHQLFIDVNSDTQVMGDRELLIQLIANLLENALRHTQAGSSILLKCSGNKITVADNGPGIPADLRHKVLEPMYRLEKSRHSSGHGLGLSMVTTIAELHNAQLTLADSNPQLFQQQNKMTTAIETLDEVDKNSNKGLAVTVTFQAIN